MDANTTTTRTPAVTKRQPPDFTEQLIEPFTELRHEVDRLFDGFPFRMPSLRLGRFAAAVPAIEMSETDKAYKITAELPGMEPGNVDVTFEEGMLRIAGEKKEQREENERGYRLTERSYGAFERMIALPPAADSQSIKAKFKNGLLTVTMGKVDEAKGNARRIKVEQ